MRHLTISVLLIVGLTPAYADGETRQDQAPHRQRARAERALHTLTGARHLQVFWPAHRSWPTAIRGLADAVDGNSPVARARRFLARHRGLLPALETLGLLDLRTAGGSSFVRFQQLHHGLPVEGAHLVVELDGEQRVRSLSSEAEAVTLRTVQPILDAGAALRVAAAHLGLDAGATRTGSARLVILPRAGGQLCYRVLLPFPADRSGRAHFIEAMTGLYLGSRVAAIIEPGVHP